MSENLCVRCGRPTPDGYACTAEIARATAQLAEIADMVPAARDIAHGLSSTLSGSGGPGKPGSRLPLDLTATAKLDGITNVLTTWVRHIAEERGTFAPGENWRHGSGPATGDLVVRCALWLPDHLEWMRHRPECDEFLTDVEAATRVMRSVARGPAAQRYLGPCGAVTPPGFDQFDYREEVTCDGDIYARDGASVGRCRACGAEVSTEARRKWLDAEVRSHAYTATEIADAYPIKANTIRQWLSRGLLVPHGEHQGRPLLNLGDVLDMAAGDAARREEARAARERRKDRTEGAAA